MKSKESSSRVIYQLMQLSNACRDKGVIFFIGSGFTKAFCKNAPVWGELLTKVLRKLEIGAKENTPSIQAGESYPAYASKICETIAREKGLILNEATHLLKKNIANLTSLYPDIRSKEGELFNTAVETLSPSYIITTNYDLCIESILGHKARTFEADDIISKNDTQIPVYHIHGSINKPDTIVITQEDYIDLLRPGEYRQSSVPVLLSGATTLFISYSINDVNVKTYVDWCNNVYKLNNKATQYQIVYKEHPEDATVLKINGFELKVSIHDNIISTNNVILLLYTLSVITKKLNSSERAKEKFLEQIEELKNEHDKTDNINIYGQGVERLIQQEEKLTRCLDGSKRVSAETFEKVVGGLFENVRATSIQTYRFHWYGLLAAISIGVLKWNKIFQYPKIFIMAVENFKFAKNNAGPDIGASYLANNYLHKRETTLPSSIKEAMYNFIENRDSNI